MNRINGTNGYQQRVSQYSVLCTGCPKIELALGYSIFDNCEDF